VSVAGSLVSTRLPKDKYALGVDEWREMTLSLKDTEEEVGNIM